MINVKFYGLLSKTLGRRKYSSVQQLEAFLSASIYETNVNYDLQSDTYHVSPKIGGRTGGGKGSPPPVPLLKPPSAGNNVLQSFSQMEVVDLICEGPIQGFCDADGVEIDEKQDPDATLAQGVFLNNTIVQNQNNTFNFRRLALNSVEGGARGVSGMQWSRSKIYRTVDINRNLVGPNMRTDNTSKVDAPAKKYNMEGQSGANYRNNFGNAVGWYLGDATTTELAKKYGYTYSAIQYGSDIRTHTETRDFTSWSPGQANYNEAAFPVTHTITNSEVDFTYATISVDGLSDTVDHGSGAGKSGNISSVKSHRVGFEIQIGINGLTDEEAKSSESFRRWLAAHGVTQYNDSPVLSVTRNYYIEGIVQGGSYLVDVGRAPWGTEFGNYSTDYQLKDISEGDPENASTPDAGRVDNVNAGELADATQFDTDADYTGGVGLNKYRQFGYKGAHDHALRQSFEKAVQTAYIDPADGSASSEGAVGTATSYDCFQLPPCDESTNFKTRYIKVTKLGREVISPLLNNSLTLKSVTEIIDEKLCMPFSAVVQQSFNSRYFNGIPSRTYHLKLKKILIPSNYFPEKRLPDAPRGQVSDKTYNGDWDGTFKEAWSDNPAWIFYDLLINNRYGLGSHVDVHKIDKWTLYKIGRYCDAVDEEGYFVGVDDTYGNNQKEPRYTCNVMITNEEESYELLKSISEIFHGIAFWDGRGVSVSMDGGSSSVPSTVWERNRSYNVGDIVESPQNSFNFFKCRVAANSINRKPGIDNNWEEHWERTPGIETDKPSMAFSNTNVDGGVFTYSNAAKSSRFTVARVSYMDKRDDFRKKYEYVEDKQGIKELGIIKKNLEPLGCTSRGQAHRMGRWFFLTSTLNTEIINFSTDYRALFLKPGNIITVNDRLKNNQQKIGKVLGIHSTDDTVLRLTEEVDIKTTLAGSGSEGANFEIILTSLDPNYSIEYINDSSNFNNKKRTLDDIDKLNNSQILRGKVESAPSSLGLDDDHIRIKNLETGEYFHFTNKLSSEQSTKKIIPPGTDWALVKPEDGQGHAEGWSAREYKVQGIAEEEEGKYTITAVYFDKEKIGSMDQKFPVITPKVDLDAGFSQSPVFDLNAPIIKELSLVSSQKTDNVKIKIDAEHPSIDGFNQSSMSTELCFYRPDGTKEETKTITRSSSAAFEYTFNSALLVSNAASEGIWYVEATSEATNSTTNRVQESATASMGVSVGNFRFRAGATPQIQNLEVNGSANSSSGYKIETENDRFTLTWNVLDIDEGNGGSGTLITDRNGFNTSPFQSGFKIGLVALDNSLQEKGNVNWIHGLINTEGAQKSLLKDLSFTFDYNERYRSFTNSEQEEQFVYPDLAQYRNLRIRIVPEAIAGIDSNGDPNYVTGPAQNVDIINKSVTYAEDSSGGSMEFVFTTPFDSAVYMNGQEGAYSRPAGWKKICYFYQKADGTIVEGETSGLNGEYPETITDGDAEYDTVFDAKREILDSDVLSGMSGIDSSGRVLTGTAAVAVYLRIKNGTRRSVASSNSSTSVPVSALGNNLGVKLMPFDAIREIAETAEPSANAGGVHYLNYRIVMTQIDNDMVDSDVVQEMGGWQTEIINLADNQDSFQSLFEEVYEENSVQGGVTRLLVMDTLSINVEGTDIDGDKQSNVGFLTAHLVSSKNTAPTAANQIASSSSPTVSIGMDEDAEAGLSNDIEKGRFIKLRVWDSHLWNTTLNKTDEEKAAELTPTVITLDPMFYMDASSNYTDLGESDDSGDVRDLKLNVNTFGDERIAGYKQFYDGLIVGGTHQEVGWISTESDIEYENLNAFTQYPLYRETTPPYRNRRGGQLQFKGSPVGIGQFNVKTLAVAEWANLMGDGNSKDVEGMTIAQDLSDLRDYHVSIKGLNLTCEKGDAGNYDGSGGLISGESLITPGMRAGQSTADFNVLPTIESVGIASVLTGEAPISTFVSNKISEQALPINSLSNPVYTEDLKISGNASIGMSGSSLIVRTAGGTIYEITGNVI